MLITTRITKEISKKGSFCKILPIRCKYIPLIVVQQAVESSCKNITFQFNHKISAQTFAKTEYSHTNGKQLQG